MHHFTSSSCFMPRDGGGWTRKMLLSSGRWNHTLTTTAQHSGPSWAFWGLRAEVLRNTAWFHTPERQEGPWQGWWGRQRVRLRQQVGQHPLQNCSLPREILLKCVLGMCPTVLAGGSGRCWQIQGKKKDLYCKWVISLALTTTRELVPLQPPWKLQGMQNQPWKWFKEQFALSMAIVDSREREQDRSHVLVLLPADVKPL